MESPQEMRVVAREEEARKLLESGVPFEEALDILLNRYWKESPGVVEQIVEQIYGVEHSARVIAKLLRKGYVEEARMLLADETKKSPRDLLIDFFSTNPDPSDESFHKLAEDNGIEPDTLEAEAYKLATEYVAFLSNGKAQEKGFSEGDADPEQLKMGIEVEKEHTTNEDTAKRIALDHLAEIADYYTRLKKMEDEANKGE